MRKDTRLSMLFCTSDGKLGLRTRLEQSSTENKQEVVGSHFVLAIPYVQYSKAQLLVGVSLSEPHSSGTAMQTCSGGLRQALGMDKHC